MKHLKFLYLINGMGMGMMTMMAFVPLIGLIVREQGLTATDAGLIVSVSGFFWMLVASRWGKRSDALGRKKVLKEAIVGYFLSYLACISFIGFSLENHINLTLVLLGMIVFRSLLGVFFCSHSASCCCGNC